MKVDKSMSRYVESTDTTDYTREERDHLRYVLRRLRYLEAQGREIDTRDSGKSLASKALSEMEARGLEFALLELGFIEIREEEE